MTERKCRDIESRKQICNSALISALKRAEHMAQSRIGLSVLYGADSENDLHHYKTIQALMVKAIALLPDNTKPPRAG